MPGGPTRACAGRRRRAVSPRPMHGHVPPPHTLAVLSMCPRPVVALHQGRRRRPVRRHSDPEPVPPGVANHSTTTVAAGTHTTVPRHMRCGAGVFGPTGSLCKSPGALRPHAGGGMMSRHAVAPIVQRPRALATSSAWRPSARMRRVRPGTQPSRAIMSATRGNRGAVWVQHPGLGHRCPAVMSAPVSFLVCSP